MLIFFLLSFHLASPLWAASLLSEDLVKFLGPAPQGFEKNYLKPARLLKKSLEDVKGGRVEPAVKNLASLSESSELAEEALRELTQLYRKKKSYLKSIGTAHRILQEFPSSVFKEELETLILEQECEYGRTEAEKGRKNKKTIDFLFRCLQKTPWKNWVEKEASVAALYEILKEKKDPLWGPFVAEVIQALPPTSNLRVKIQKGVPSEQLEAFSSIARFKTRTSPPPGVKAVNPDLEIFDQGMAAVMEKNWASANEIFRKIERDFSGSEHADRAQYWIARSEEAQGNQEKALQIFEKIFAEAPLSYYGLQAALKLKKDLSQYTSPPTIPIKTEPLIGSLLPFQIKTLWKLRAFLEVGLIEQAREEARALFQSRPGGFTFGQESPAGAYMVGLLYHTANFSLAAFSHAHAAVNLDMGQLNSNTLRIIFPINFQNNFEKASESSGINPLLLFSVTKQESAFLPNAVSRAFAVGLMQLLHSTAREMDPAVSKEKLFEPETNSALGAKYLQKLLERFQGNIALALAGYNAGPSRASQWQKRFLESTDSTSAFDLDLFVDTIPFTETRRYVSSIMRNYAWYRMIEKQEKIGNLGELVFQWQKEKKETQL